MGFLDPRQQEDDESLGGLAGLHVDLDTRICPACRREAAPWQGTCPDCGTATVPPRDLPPASFPLRHLDVEDGGDETST